MPFNVTKNIKLNLLRPELTVVHGKQYDNSSRIIVAQLYEDNTKWVAPENILGVISYIKPDGNYGFYDETDLGEQAVVFDPDDRSICTLILSTQALTCDGKVKVEVNFYDIDNARRLSSFAFTLDVEKSTITQDDLTSSSEFRILAEQIAQVLEAAENLSGLTAEANTLSAGSSATAVVTGGSGGTPYKITFGIPQGIQGQQGIQGIQGVSVSSIELISGDHSAGTEDTYRISLSNSTYFDFQVYNGANGAGAVSTVSGIQPVGGDVPLLLVQTSDPTTSTVGKVNQFCFNKTNGILFICTAISGSTYTWQQAGKALDFYTEDPEMDGIASAGTSDNVARGDHVHPTDLTRQPTNFYYEDVTVLTSAWVANNTYPDYPYRAAIYCDGVDDNMLPQVMFAPTEALSGNYAPVAQTYTDYVYIYAKEIPASNIIIPSILVSDSGVMHSANQSRSWAEDAEAWARGTKDGTAVPSTDPTYNNNSRYYSQLAAQSATEAAAFVGSPLRALTAAQMTNTEKVYVYAGTESGYTKGNWYYYNGLAWVSGGVYMAADAEIATLEEMYAELYG